MDMVILYRRSSEELEPGVRNNRKSTKFGSCSSLYILTSVTNDTLNNHFFNTMVQFWPAKIFPQNECIIVRRQLPE